MNSYLNRQLTPRELKVLEYVSHGLSNKEIARRLGIKPSTVRVHLGNVYDKFDYYGANSRVLATRWYIMNAEIGLCSPDNLGEITTSYR